jgi:YHS domain-containing protein
MCIYEPFVENRLRRFAQEPKMAHSLKFFMKNRRLIISLVVLFGFSMLASGQARKSNPRPKTPRTQPVNPKSNVRPEKARDPVCGIMVEKDPQLAAEHKGKTYYFCSKADRDKFKQNPEKYVKDK